MLIGVEKRFLFVANTKTASTSIEDVLLPHAEVFRMGTSERKHISLADTKAKYGFLFNNPNHSWGSYFKFGVMRDPLDWIGSWYRYRRGNQVHSPLPRDMTFAEFWAQADWNIRFGSGNKNLQKRMFTTQDGDVLADVIIPYHRVDEYFPELCKLLHIPYNLPRKNVSVLRDVGSIPAALREEVLDFYAEDYALWERLDEINAAGMAQLRTKRAKVG